MSVAGTWPSKTTIRDVRTNVVRWAHISTGTPRESCRAVISGRYWTSFT